MSHGLIGDIRCRICYWVMRVLVTDGDGNAWSPRIVCENQACPNCGERYRIPEVKLEPDEEGRG